MKTEFSHVGRKARFHEDDKTISGSRVCESVAFQRRLGLNVGNHDRRYMCVRFSGNFVSIGCSNQASKKVGHSSTSGQDEIFLKSWYWDEIFLHFIRRF